MYVCNLIALMTLKSEKSVFSVCAENLFDIKKIAQDLTVGGIHRVNTRLF